jgi:hypothetical protein
MTSCLGNDEYVDPTVSTDAQLVAFGISSDSIKTLASVVFSIDQEKGEIYNNDSLPYLTNLDTIGKVKLSFTTGLGLASSVRVDYLDGDSAVVASGDSIWVATQYLPLQLKVYAQDPKVIKTYTVRVNVHQIDPDSVQYTPIDQLPIGSTTMDVLTTAASNCPYPVKAALGFLQPDIQKGLALVVEKDGKNVFAYSENLTDYTYSDNEIPTDFPLAGFSRINNNDFAPRLTVIKNLQSVWATENGLYWINLSNVSNNAFPTIEGGNAFVYNNEIWFILGHINDGAYNEKVYYSKNAGVVWDEKPTKAQAPEDFTLRENAEVIVDADGKYFYISGGRNIYINGLVVPDNWQVALNSRLF